MTTVERVRRTPARSVLVAGLVTAAVGVIVLILVGVPGFPLIPPGPIILLVAAGLVAFLPWRWAPVLGLLAALYSSIPGRPPSRHHSAPPLGLGALGTYGAVTAGYTAAMLSTPSEVGPFAGSLIQVVGLAIALVAGLLATVRAR